MVENVIQIKGGIEINVSANVKFITKHSVCEKDYNWNPAVCAYESGKYLASIIKDSVITWD